MSDSLLLQISGRVSRDDEHGIVSELRELLPLSFVAKIEYRGADPPTLLQLVADALSWATVLKVASGAFLTKLAGNAADDLWKNKSKLASLLADSVATRLRQLAALLAKVNRLYGPHATVQIGFPVPDEYWGTVLRITSTDEFECARQIVYFIQNGEFIEAEARSLLASGVQPLGLITVIIQPDGSIFLRWSDERGVERQLPVPLRRVG